MKVIDLIKQLTEMPMDHNVILSSDAEGNSYYPVDFVMHSDKGIIIYPEREGMNI